MQTQDISVNKSIVKFMFSLLVFGFLATGMASATTQAARADARASSLVFNSFQIRTKTVDPDRQEREQVLAEFSARHTLSVLQDLKDTGERELWDGNLILFISLAIQLKQ